jgi:tetratricopeptide (TPR) repeat protein
MNDQNFSPELPSKNYGTQLDAVRVQLRSLLPSDVWRGMVQVRKWLQEDSESQDVYALLLDVVQVNTTLRQEIRELLEEMSKKGSSSATEALRVLPASVQDVLNDGDDAYYAADYDQAIQIYRQVLLLDPQNVRAKDQLAKSELNRIAGMPDTGLPRAAVQYFRRARSHYAARDVPAAMQLLNAALDAAQAKGVDFPEAKSLLNSMQDLLTADEYKAKGDLAFEKEQWGEALDQYNKALLLDPHNDNFKKMLESLQGLLRAEVLLDSLANQESDESDRIDKLERADTFRKAAYDVDELTDTSLLKRVNAKYNLYKADAEIQSWGILKFLAPKGRLRKAQSAAQEVLKPSDPSLKYIGNELNNLRLRRIGFVSILFLLMTSIIAVIALQLQVLGTGAGQVVPQPTSINPPTKLSTATLPGTSVSTPSEAPSIAPTHTITLTSSITPTPYRTGFTTRFVHPLTEPDGSWLGAALDINQPVLIIREEKGSQNSWYLCEWEVNGEKIQGWILTDFVQIGSILGPDSTLTTTPTQ